MTVPTGFCVCVAEGHPELCPNTPGRCAFKCAEYSAGKIKPAYPVPAIRQWFEWGWNLTENEPALIHVQAGVYNG